MYIGTHSQIYIYNLVLSIVRIPVLSLENYSVYGINSSRNSTISLVVRTGRKSSESSGTFSSTSNSKSDS